MGNMEKPTETNPSDKALHEERPTLTNEEIRAMTDEDIINNFNNTPWGKYALDSRRKEKDNERMGDEGKASSIRDKIIRKISKLFN